MKSQLFPGFRSTLGILLSIVAAIAAAFAAQGKHMNTLVPLVFAVVLILLASRFGAVVALIGSIISAVVFANLLYSPLGKLQVQSEGARTNLAWMILISVAGAYLLFPSRESGSKH